MKKQLLTTLGIAAMCLTACGGDPNKVTKEEFNNFFANTTNFTMVTSADQTEVDEGMEMKATSVATLKRDGDLAEVDIDSSMVMTLTYGEDEKEIAQIAVPLLVAFLGGEVTKDGTEDGVWEVTIDMGGHFYEEKIAEGEYKFYTDADMTYEIRDEASYINGLSEFSEIEELKYDNLKYDGKEKCYFGTFDAAKAAGETTTETDPIMETIRFYFDAKKLTKYTIATVNDEGNETPVGEVAFSDYGTTTVEFDASKYTEYVVE